LPLLGQAGFQALAPDLPGYGQTRPDPGHDLSLAGAAEIVAAFLDTLGLGPVWLVGHDLGGGVAQVFASRYPQRLSRLTLGDTVAEDSWPVTPIRLFRAIARLGLYPAVAAARLVPNPYAWWELRRGFADSRRLLPEDARRVFWDGKVSAPEGRRLFAAHLRALDPAQTVAAAPGLASLSVPVQLLWAAQDRFQTWENVGQRLAALLPEPRVDLVKDAGHFLPLERPREYAQALLAWGSSAAA
jgi:pimeloyl-ACP methyl ester carboxylesterase